MKRKMTLVLALIMVLFISTFALFQLNDVVSTPRKAWYFF